MLAEYKATQSSTNIYQIDSLDGARGIAVLIVLWSHTSNAGLFFFPNFNGAGTGKAGVFLFFILSAYLLTRPFICAFQTEFRLKYFLNYAMRRCLRIFPLYTVYLLIAVITTLYFNVTIGGVTKPLPFSLNWGQFWKHILLQEGKSVTWSIPVEFKYYLILPVFAYLYSKAIRYGLLAISTILLLSWGALNLFRYAYNIDFELLHTITYAEIFMIGSYAAAIKVVWDNNPPSHILRHYVSLSALIATAFLLFFIPSVYSNLIEPVKSNFMHKSIFLYSILWFFFLLNLLIEDNITNHILSFKYLRLIGNISFSLYLIHAPIIALVLLLEINPYLSAWLILSLSILLSSLTYLCVERPLSKMKLPMGK